MSQRVLILNSSYAPLAVVPLRRAVILVLAEKAEVIESDGARAIRSSQLTIPFPRVIRLLRFVRVPFTRRVPVTRRAVLQRDDFTCAYCHGHADTMDHVVPKAHGGKHTWRNVVAACKACNNKKGHRTLKELGWTLGFKPYEPAGTAALVVVVGVIDETWESYLAVA